MEINQAFVHDILAVEGRPQLFKNGKEWIPQVSVIAIHRAIDVLH